MKSIVAPFLLATGVFCWPISALTQEAPPPPVTISPLGDHLHVITCTGGSEFNLPPFGTNLVASVGPDGVFLVDAGFAATGQALRDTLKALGYGRISAVINTHFHGDHTFGNQALKDEAMILAHQNAVSRLSGDYYSLPGQPDPNRPAAGFSDSLILHFNGEEIHVVHTPNCHTTGDVYVYFTGSAVVAAGDLFFADEIPYVDLADGGTVSGYLAQVERFINAFPDEIVFVPGHGRQYTKADLRQYHRMLAQTTRLVREATADGKTADDMIQDELLADWAQWKGQFPTTTLETWIRTIHTEVTGGVNTKPSICAPLTRSLATGTSRDAIQQYYRLKSTQYDAYDFGEAQLNMLGYQLLTRNRIDDALEIFRLNIEIYPNSFNVYDSYGEALMIKGDTVQSIANYKKSLELNPDNTNAVEMLERLGRDK